MLEDLDPVRYHKENDENFSKFNNGLPIQSTNLFLRPDVPGFCPSKGFVAISMVLKLISVNAGSRGELSGAIDTNLYEFTLLAILKSTRTPFTIPGVFRSDHSEYTRSQSHVMIWTRMGPLYYTLVKSQLPFIPKL